MPGNPIGIFHTLLYNGNFSHIIAVLQGIAAHVPADASGTGLFIPVRLLWINIPSLIPDLYTSLISTIINIRAVIAGTDPSGFPGTQNFPLVDAAADYRHNGVFPALPFQHLAFAQSCNSACTIVSQTFRSHFRPVHTILNKSPVYSGYAAHVTFGPLNAPFRHTIFNPPFIDHTEHPYPVFIHIPYKRGRAEGKIAHLTLPPKTDKHAIASL